MMCESKMISKNNDEIDVGCGNAFGGEGAEEAGSIFDAPKIRLSLALK